MNTVVSGIILVALGAGAIAVGLYLLLHEKLKRKRCTEHITGTVTGFDSSRVDNGPYNPVPVCKYTVNGCDYSIRASVGVSDKLAKIMDSAEILYDPKNPSCAVFAFEKDNVSAGCIITAVIGLIVLATGVLVLVI